MLCGLLLPTPSVTFLSLLRLLLALGGRFPILGTLGGILLELPTIVGLGMAEFAVRTRLVSSVLTRSCWLLCRHGFHLLGEHLHQLLHLCIAVCRDSVDDFYHCHCIEISIFLGSDFVR